MNSLVDKSLNPHVTAPIILTTPQVNWLFSCYFSSVPVLVWIPTDFSCQTNTTIYARGYTPWFRNKTCHGCLTGLAAALIAYCIRGPSKITNKSGEQGCEPLDERWNQLSCMDQLTFATYLQMPSIQCHSEFHWSWQLSTTCKWLWVQAPRPWQR